jgi:hypothetical protein
MVVGEKAFHMMDSDVGGNEERDATAETVALLQKLIKQNDNHAGDDKLENEEEDDASTKIGRRAVEASEDVDGGSAGGENEGKELLGGLVELAV